jgi:hypothetical protein
MQFWAQGESDPPSPETAALGSKVVSNHAELVTKIATRAPSVGRRFRLKTKTGWPVMLGIHRRPGL